MNLKPYPEYKDSGIQWIEQMPKHWEINRGKWLFQKVERTVRDTDDIVTCFRDGVVTLRKNRRISGFTEAIKEIGYQGIRKGDLVIHQMDAFAGAVGVSDSDGKGTPVYSVCIPKDSKINTKYYAHIVREMARSQYVLSLAKGIRERSTDFRFNTFANQNLPIPTQEEQIQIARFLDYKTAQIARFVKAKKRLIELLKEQKQVIINDAVTGKIDVATGKPYPKYKDSGVGWLGQVPEGWEVRRLKYVAKMKSGDNITSVTIEEKGDYPVYGGNGLRGYASSFTHEGLHILIGRQGALCGNINYTTEGKFWASEHAVVVSPKIDLDLFWFGELLKAMNLNQYSIAAAQPGLSVDRILNLSIPFPALNEQKRISESIKTKTSDIDLTISRTERELSLIREFRTRLISDVVTGKTDVRDIEIPDIAEIDETIDELPDESEGEEGAEENDP